MFKVVKYQGNLAEFDKRVNNLNNNWENTTDYGEYITPSAIFCSNLKVPDDIKKDLESTIKNKIHDVFWMTNYNSCKHLRLHKDLRGNDHYNIKSRLNAIFLLEGTFEFSFWEDDEKTLIDKVVFGPGDILITRYTEFYHSGLVLDGHKRSFHFYLDVPQIDNSDKDFDINEIV